MRIRSIRPEFWTSNAISSLDLEDRLLFIGVWSYVDDNGVGIDRLSLIATELFPDDIEREPRETFARVSRGLANLSEAGRITRYTVGGKDYLSVTNWSEHQKIDKPGKARYPLPTTANAIIRDSVATVSRDSGDISAPGEGEKGRRGEGDSTLRVEAPVADEPDNLPALRDINAPAKADAPRTRGTRLPDDWQPARSDANLSAEEGHDPDWLRREYAKFRDHWASQPGQKGVKTNWDATWRNWLRKAEEFAPRNNNRPKTAASMTQLDWDDAFRRALQAEAEAERNAS